MEEQNVRKKRLITTNTWTGLLFLLVGGVLLLRQSGYPLPPWLFTWEAILILVGLFIGVRHGFRDFSWLIMVIIGLVFLSDDLWPGIQLRQYAVPVIIITLGLLFILAPKNMCRGRGRFRRGRSPFAEPLPMESTLVQDTDVIKDPALDIVSIFAGIKKNVLSKQFGGGEIVCVFGGAEINLTNADFTSPIILDLTLVFGGAKLTIPSNWEVRSEVTAIFGGIDDKRPQPPGLIPEKTIILKGTLMFGGVEVNSF